MKNCTYIANYNKIMPIKKLEVKFCTNKKIQVSLQNIKFFPNYGTNKKNTLLTCCIGCNSTSFVIFNLNMTAHSYLAKCKTLKKHRHFSMKEVPRKHALHV